MNKRSIILSAILLWCSVLSAQNADTLNWRYIFNDPNLVSLVDTALVHNTDLKKASFHVDQAYAALRMTRFSMFRSLSVGIDETYSKEKNAAGVSKYSLPIRLQWEISLSGRLIAEKKSARSLYWGAEQTEQAVRLQLICAVASQYYTLQMLDQHLAITCEGVENARRTVEVMEALKEAGMQNEAAVSQARVALLSASASEKNLRQQISIAENVMIMLIGKYMDSIPRSSFAQTSLPVDYTGPYSLESLSERPDVKAAEFALASSLEQVKVARSAFYPTLTVSATFSIADLLAEAVGSLVQPLFSMGRNKWNLRIAQAAQQEALADFTHTLLNATSELKDAMSSCLFSSDRISIREQEVDAAAKACDASMALMQSGSATYLEVLSAQAALLQSRLSLVSDRMDLIQGQINLYKALGGNILLSLQKAAE